MENEIRILASKMIGYDNYGYKINGSENWLATGLLQKLCFQDYKVLESKLKQKYILCIDSLYAEKEKRLNFIRSNLNSITQAYVDNFISTFHCSDPDFRSLQIIITNHTKLFFNSIYYLSETDFYGLTLKLGQFPQEIDLSQMKSAIENESSKGKRKRKVSKAIRNNKV